MDLLRSSQFSVENDSVGPHLGGARWPRYEPQGALNEATLANSALIWNTLCVIFHKHSVSCSVWLSCLILLYPTAHLPRFATRCVTTSWNLNRAVSVATVSLEHGKPLRTSKMKDRILPLAKVSSEPRVRQLVALRVKTETEVRLDTTKTQIGAK